MSANNGRESRRAKRARHVAMTQGMAISHPPQLTATNLKFATTLRFYATTGGYTSFSYQNLLDAYLVAATATTGFQLFQAVKVKYVELWAMPTSAGVPTTVSVEYAGTIAGSIGDQIYHDDTSMGVQPAHVKASPSKLSLASMYQISGTTAFATLKTAANTVIDVHVVYRGQFDNTTAVANALVGATAGAVYLRGLDGVAAATTVYPSVWTENTI
jgi:hypothetical protein